MTISSKTQLPEWFRWREIGLYLIEESVWPNDVDENCDDQCEICNVYFHEKSGNIYTSAQSYQNKLVPFVFFKNVWGIISHLDQNMSLSTGFFLEVAHLLYWKSIIINQIN